MVNKLAKMSLHAIISLFVLMQASGVPDRLNVLVVLTVQYFVELGQGNGSLAPGPCNYCPSDLSADCDNPDEIAMTFDNPAAC
jgi:hypothetical protein